MKKLLLALMAVVGFTFWASAEEVTFDFANETYGYPREQGNSGTYMSSPSTLENGDAIITLTSDEKGFRFWTDGLRLFKNKNAKMSVSVPDAVISKIEITTKSNKFKLEVEAPTTGTYTANGTSLTWTAGENAEPVDAVTFAYTATDNVAMVSMKITYEPAGEPAPKLSYRRYYTDASKRYYNYIAYSVNGNTKELYSINDPSTEDYFVTPLQNQWQTEGAYIDFTDKVIEVPADAVNFTMILKSNTNACSSLWSQNAVLVDWNKNGIYNEEGETNGVINITKKANEPGGGLVITETGETDVITLPETIKPGQKYSLIIAMTEPKGIDGKQDLWGKNWEWTKEIFADDVCSLINGQAYELTVLITEPLVNPEPAGLEYSANAFTATINAENEFPTLANPNNLTVVYTSSNEDVATVSQTGAITLIGLGTTTISATSEATQEFEAGNASYTLTVVKGCANLAEFIAATPNKNDTAVMNGAVTVVYVNGAYVYVKDETASSLIYKFGLEYKAGDVIPGGWEGKNSVYYGLYEIVPTGNMPAATEGAAQAAPVFEGTITAEMMNQVVKLQGVEFAEATSASKANFTGVFGEQTLTFRNNFTLSAVEAGTYDVIVAVAVYNNDIQLYPIEYIASATEPEPAGLAYSVKTFKAVTGAENDFPTLANPNELTINYTSSNEAVATINETGDITLVAPGTTTITATSVATDKFESGSASYTLTVVKGCATLAEFIAATPEFQDAAVMNGEVTVVYTKGANVYVKDATASSLIYKVQHGYNAGDVIPGGWEGKNGSYRGLYEITPGVMPAATPGETPEIPVYEGDITTAMMNQIVKINNVQFVESTPDTKVNFNGVWKSETLLFYNNFYVESVAAGNYDVVVAVGVYDDMLQLYPISYAEAQPEATIVSSKDFTGTLSIDMGDGPDDVPNTTITLNKYSDDTYGIYLANFGASEGGGLGAINLTGLVLEGTMLTGSVKDYEFTSVGAFADIDIAGTYDESSLQLHLDVNLFDPFDMPMVLEFTSGVSDPEPVEAMTYRRKYTDASSRYYNYLGYTVNGSTIELYTVDNPAAEDYYVNPLQNQWQTEGAYIDFTDKVIEIPANAGNFTMIMKSHATICSSKWSQNAVLIDWNKNGVYNEDNETNGVINLGIKANDATRGARVITADGEKDTITLPDDLEPGDEYNVLIVMNEPKGVDGTQDLWDAHWEWTKDIFADNTCSLINGQAYGMKLKVTEPTVGINDIAADDNADAEIEYYTIQGIKVSAENLTPGFYVARQGNKAYKILVK